MAEEKAKVIEGKLLTSMFSYDKQKEAYLDMYKGIGQDLDKWMDESK